MLKGRVLITYSLSLQQGYLVLHRYGCPLVPNSAALFWTLIRASRSMKQPHALNGQALRQINCLPIIWLVTENLLQRTRLQPGLVYLFPYSITDRPWRKPPTSRSEDRRCRKASRAQLLGSCAEKPKIIWYRSCRGNNNLFIAIL